MKLSPFYAKAVPFCEASGKQLDEVTLPEAVRPTFHKRGGFSDSGFYYKGAGILYCGHLSDRILPGMLQIGENNCPYQKYQVIYPLLYGKFGIFAFRHQPVFRDYEGGCGPKACPESRSARIFRRGRGIARRKAQGILGGFRAFSM